MTVATLVFPMLKSTLRIGPQAGIYGKKTPTDLQNESPETEMPYNMLHRTDFQGEN